MRLGSGSGKYMVASSIPSSIIERHVFVRSIGKVRTSAVLFKLATCKLVAHDSISYNSLFSKRATRKPWLTVSDPVLYYVLVGVPGA